MIKQQRDQTERPCFSHEAARHLYRLGYRITADGRLSRPRYGIERIRSTNSKVVGPITTVMLTCSDGLPREVQMNYAHLALLSFFGPQVLKPGVRAIFKDHNPHNLTKANVNYTLPKPKRFVEDKRVAVWRAKGEREDLLKLKERPELTDPTTCGALLLALESHLTTLERAARRLNTTVAMVVVMLHVARQQRAHRNKHQEPPA